MTTNRDSTDEAAMLAQLLTDDLYVRFVLVILVAVLLGYLVGTLSRRAADAQMVRPSVRDLRNLIGELDAMPKRNVVTEQPLDYPKER
jgi:hypothetical protein